VFCPTVTESDPEDGPLEIKEGDKQLKPDNAIHEALYVVVVVACAFIRGTVFIVRIRKVIRNKATSLFLTFVTPPINHNSQSNLKRLSRRNEPVKNSVKHSRFYEIPISPHPMGSLEFELII